MWVPERKENGAAMDELRRIAGPDPDMAGLAALGVSA